VDFVFIHKHYSLYFTRDIEVKEHGDDNGYKFRRLIKSFRDKLQATGAALTNHVTLGNNNNSQFSSHTSKLSVFVRKRPLSKKEKSIKGYDIITCTPEMKLICHEPKLKFDLSESLENHDFSFDA